MKQSFYFYDLETSGFNPKEARVMQFAGQRTDMSLEALGEPDNYLIKLTSDVVPDPEAVLITGITPQTTISEGLSEAEFLKIFHQKIAVPGTIFTGFNSIRFDDEFIRYMNYRNFYDPYEWHWKDDRSRWDLLDVVRMTRALRPSGIEWPVDSKGVATNRLEYLSSVNKLDHAKAHDALSDVQATIELAKLIRQNQPKLFDFLVTHRTKERIEKLVSGHQMFVYTSGKYASEFEKTTVVTRLADHPSRAGAVLVYDLRHDPEPFLKLTAEELVETWRWKKDSNEPRLPVKTLQYNRCPAVAPLGVLDEKSALRLGLDQTTLRKNLAKLTANDAFVGKIFEALQLLDKLQQARLLEEGLDVDGRLYDGFFDNQDKVKIQTIQRATENQIAKLKPSFKDARLEALWPLYKARNYPKTLSEEERDTWEKFRSRKLMGGKQNSRLASYFERIEALRTGEQLTDAKKYLLEELSLYGQSIMPDA